MDQNAALNKLLDADAIYCAERDAALDALDALLDWIDRDPRDDARP